MSEIEGSKHEEMLSTIVERYILQGVVDPSKIAKAMGIKRGEAVMYIEEWRSIAQNSQQLQERSRELLTELDRGYDKAINEWWNIINDSETPVHVRNSALKNYTEALTTRQGILEKAGLYDSMEEREEIQRTQAIADEIRQLLQDVTAKYPETKTFILKELGRIFGRAESTGVVEGKVIEE